MDEQGGAGGVPLHHDDAGRQHRKPRPERHGSAPGSKPEPDLPPVRREDTDEASRLDRPGAPEQDPAEPRKHRSHGKGPDEF
ncbi:MULTISPECIES: hypothetical protein [Streptomyces]|uniref:Uncharacterized protein n=1 Tax=Streptomyces katrae TaxID=68223 RepID=A0ABT7H6J8_9ACTN|nr:MULTISPECIES: hypothetical protein [Streptomyces]MDK9500685.1 hypothetical protein [Streptomyces katrae]RST00201.1 hypothetical protein EF910_32765 [Streptomyces sp. WAC07149]GLX17647.1 hypothetical protein Slala01_12910 [Streptomyces lavendulae subsp. lavendulae]GLX24492.1 hypothetical protein Slala02_03120 [Streptomyces lavendulae subsp. lavendulae]